jgi:hypothetical protein
VRTATALAVLGALLIAAPAAAGEYRLRVVARVGAPSPAGGVFDRFGVESLPVVAPVNGRGEVAFFASLARAATGEGLFLAGPARTVKIAAEGDRAGAAGIITGFGKHPVPALNGSGTVAFQASLSGGRAVEGIFTAAVGKALRALALSGRPAPGIPSGTLAALEAPALNDRGDVAFLATVQRGREPVDAIYLAAGGRLVKVAAQGDRAPGGGTFAAFGPPSLSNRGAVAFAAIIEGGRALGGVFLAEAPGQVRAVAATGEASPLGGYFARFSDRVSVNEGGQVAFHAVVNDGSAPGGIFVAAGDHASVAAALGAETPVGGRFAGFGLWPALAPDGGVAFVGAVDGGRAPVGVFLARGGRIEPVVLAGAESPAGAIASFSLYPALSINRDGAIAFPVAPTAGAAGANAILVAEPR